MKFRQSRSHVTPRRTAKVDVSWLPSATSVKQGSMPGSWHKRDLRSLVHRPTRMTVRDEQTTSSQQSSSILTIKAFSVHTTVLNNTVTFQPFIENPDTSHNNTSCRTKTPPRSMRHPSLLADQIMSDRIPSKSISRTAQIQRT